MKKLLLPLIAFLFVTSTVLAQETDPAKLLKSAKKALSSFSLDPSGNKPKLVEAKTNIDLAVKNEANNTHDAWLTYGNIYSELANQDEAAKILKPKDKGMNPTAPFEAVKAFKKAFELAAKKFEKSDAIKGIVDNYNRLINSGADAYSEKDFARAYEVYNLVANTNSILKDAKEKSALDDSKLNTLVYYSGVCAQAANLNPQAETVFKSLIGKGTEDEAACYSSLYAVLNAQDKKDEAVKVLEEGVKKYPNATDLLFSQINYYLREGKLDVLIDKLKLAIEKEPGNVGLYSTLGNVYDNLAQIEAKNGNAEKSKGYFDNAMKTYGDVLAKEPKNFDANYSLGALYYNKAAGFTEQLNKLNDDYSDAGVKKYEALKEEMNGVFKQALPYFQKAESANPNDKNTLIALKEILIRVNMMNESNAIKERLQTVEDGKQNKDSYFKN